MMMYRCMIICMVVCAAASMNPTLVTIAVISTPASPSMLADYYDVNEKWTYVAGSTVDYVGLGAGMALTVPFDYDDEKLKYMIGKVDGVLISAQYVPLVEGGAWSSYMNKIRKIVRWVQEENQKGAYKPIIALGNGMNALLYSYLDDNTHSVTCENSNKIEFRNIHPTPQFTNSEYWKMFDKSGADTVFNRQSLIFNQGCSMSKKLYDTIPSLDSIFRVTGTSTDKRNEEVISMVEHKSMPFYGVQYHIEKHMYERGDTYSAVDRSEEVVVFSQQVVSNIFRLIRSKGKPQSFDKIPLQIKQYFALYRPAELPLTEEFERIYTFQRYYTG